MADDRTEGHDVCGDAWEAAACTVGSSAADIHTEHWPMRLCKKDSARLGSFLLSAASVDLVSAAQKVLEMRDATTGNGGRLVRRPCSSGSCKGTVCGPATEIQARLDALAAELAKLDEALR